MSSQGGDLGHYRSLGFGSSIGLDVLSLVLSLRVGI